MGDQPVGEVGLFGVALLAGLDHLARLVAALLHGFQVGEDKLEVDGRNIVRGVDPAVDVNDVFILEAAHHVHDRVHLADMAQELVAQALAAARALDEARDIDELDCGGSGLLGVIHLRQHVQPAVGHGDDAGIRLDRAERIVGGFRAGLRNRIKKRALAHVRETHDAKFHL